ncbi:hypothetical protein PoB_006709900 [Plakobranchus ocellatus]|uniref:CHHC U11-48K-type domain-containing protein n=1 Tax=Plakobranchus ocellatus TaxID=259542 RepID=A0AAV4D8S8_9GAST|nr:hypothetical protein PoB_006709900 [Plakobranchus ocellatus]
MKQPPCPHETVAHHLFECPSLKDLRARFLPPDSTYTTPSKQMLSSYSRLTNTMLGQGVKELTPNDSWITERKEKRKRES